MNRFALAYLILSMAMPQASARLGAHRKLKTVNKGNNAVPGQYIVLVNDNVQDVRGPLNAVLHANENAKIHHFYENALRGFLLSNVPDNLLQRLLDSADVKEIYEVSCCFSCRPRGKLCEHI